MSSSPHEAKKRRQSKEISRVTRGAGRGSMRDLAWTLAIDYSMLMSSRHSEQTQMQYMLSTVYAVCRVWYLVPACAPCGHFLISYTLTR